MHRPPALDSVYVVAAVVMAAAALFEAGYGGPEAEFTPLSVVSALLTGLAVLVARWTPLGAIVLAGGGGRRADAVRPRPASVGRGAADRVDAAGRQRGLPALAQPRPDRVRRRGVVPAVTIVVAGESVWEFLFYGLILASGLGGRCAAAP